MTFLGTAWDKVPAEILLHYKSGQRHRFDTDVKDARRRASIAANRKSVNWIKVTIPNPDSTKAIVCIFEPRIGWTKNIVDLPKVKQDTEYLLNH